MECHSFPPLLSIVLVLSRLGANKGASGLRMQCRKPTHPIYPLKIQHVSFKLVNHLPLHLLQCEYVIRRRKVSNLFYIC
ncbi:hypothetical protein BD414DRAFT_473609 [Trametes punicea]|nr:hypothetical protein BD414DRAFT_473609 [Trametes punicea]